jgi:hypothetical protein
MTNDEARTLHNPFVADGHFRSELQIDCSIHSPESTRIHGPAVALYSASSQWIQLLSQMKGVTAVFVDRPRTDDLSHLAELPLLTFSVSYPSRVNNWSFLQRLDKLKRLSLHNTLTLGSLEPIQAMNNLEVLEVSGGYSTDLRLPSLEPVSHLKRLKTILLASVQFTDWTLTPLLNLPALERFNCPLKWPKDQLNLVAQQRPALEGNWRA